MTTSDTCAERREQCDRAYFAGDRCEAPGHYAGDPEFPMVCGMPVGHDGPHHCPNYNAEWR